MDAKASKRTNEVVARWVVRLDAGALSAEEQHELDAWLEAAPHHRGALIRARAAWVDLDRIGALAGGSTHSDTDDSSFPLPSGTRVGVRGAVRGNRRWLLAASIAGLAVLGASWFALNIGRDVYESGIGEVRRVTLADGSRMVLNTSTRTIVRIDDAKREVRLERGEALFQVEKDAARPFIVRTDDLTVRAVGTAFAVRVDGLRVDVTVTEGVVEVVRAVDPPQRVTANQRAIVKSQEPVAIEAIEPATADRQLAWREGMVAFDGESLSDAVAEINRHSRRQIRIADPALGARPVVGIFRASDVEGFAHAAATALGAEALDEGDIIRLAPAERH